MEAALLIGLAMGVLVATRALGTLLVLAILVGPAATARLFTHRAPAMIATAAIVAVTAGVAGLYLSFYADTAAGASIAGVIVILYLAAQAVSTPLRAHENRVRDQLA